jgi:hypothetical protein
MNSRPETQQMPSTRPTRRALLAGALGGIGAWAMGSIGRSSPVSAANGDIMHVGDTLTGTTGTTLNLTSGSGGALKGTNTGTGVGVWGVSSLGSGIRGEGGDAGVLGIGPTGVFATGSNRGSYAEGQGDYGAIGVSITNNTGVLGLSGNGDGIPTTKPNTGVFGHAAQASSSRGVWGSSPAGAGLYGESDSGFGLQVVGRATFSTSGVATISAGNDHVTVTPGVNVTASSFVLLTAKTSVGGRDIWFTQDTTADTFTIHMSSSRSSSTRIAWLFLS